MSKGVFDDEDENGWTCVKISNRKFWAHVSEPVSGNGVRIGFDIKPDLLEWMDEHVGERVTMRQLGVWRNDIPITSTFTNVFFKDHNKALLFKLTWG